MKISQIAKVIGGELISLVNDVAIETICFDSRLATHSPNELFISFKGLNSNGHTFIPKLRERGSLNFLVEEDCKLPSNVNVIKVKSCLKSLQTISADKRQKFNGHVVGITGSNGKTIVKEWLTIILAQEKMVLASPKSYNSQLGVPLSVWPLNEQYDLGVFEAGISQPNEMSVLQEIIDPDIGIFTNIGSAHSEHFHSVEEKVLEKLQLFEHSNVLIYDLDDTVLTDIIENNFAGNKIGWSRSGKGVCLQLSANGELSLKWKSEEYVFKVPFSDDASIQNISHCVICALHLGYSKDSIQSGLDKIRPVKMRLELKKGVRGNIVIDDTYNNDFAGLTKALNFLDQHGLSQRKVVVLSDFIQSTIAIAEFEQLNQLLLDKGIDTLIAIGTQLEAGRKNFEVKSTFYLTTEAFLESDELENFSNCVILIKGSRQFALERVSLVLSEKIHQTALEINMDAIRHNLAFYRSLLKPDTKVMAVIKAFAYGSGSTEVARLLEYNGVDYLAVAYADEGVALRRAGISTPIMVINSTVDDVYNMIKFNLEPEVFSTSQLNKLIESYKSFRKKLTIHLVLNTGMNRLGFDRDDLQELKAFLIPESDLVVKSIFSHLAASDEDEHQEFTELQIHEFKKFSNEVMKILPNQPYLHILNSGGITRFPQHQLDMVRFGIGLHGVEVNRKFQNKLMRPAVLRTTISQVREIKKGETIGYGRKGKALTDMQIAVIAVGYADGYLRVFGNGNAYVSIQGKKAKTIGNVCMDMTMIDVTGLAAAAGDEVIVFGEVPSISDLAEWANTIPYEILTNISNRVKRVFYSE